MAIKKSNRKKLKRNETRILGLLSLGGGLLVLGIAVLILLPDTPAVAVGVPAPIVLQAAAPQLELSDTAGNPVALADHKGKVTLVNNWATWCPPCKKEMPALESYYQAHKDDDFTLVAINAGDPVEWITEFVDEFKISFPVWVDRKQTAIQTFNNFGLPSTYVIDKSGTIRMYWNGEITEKTLEKYVTPLLKE